MIIDTFPDEENVKENSRKVFFPSSSFSVSHVKIKEDTKIDRKIIVVLKIHLEYVVASIMHNILDFLFPFAS